METLDYLYEQISKSEITLIGYRFSDERIKDEIISNLPKVRMIDLNSSFSMKEIFRDIKIEQILTDQDTKYLILDVNDLRLLFKDRNNFTDSDISNSKLIESTVYTIRYYLRNNRSEIFDIKLIITCPLNTSKKTISINDSFFGGNAVLYYSDLAIVIEKTIDNNKIIRIIKNRNDDSNKTIKYDYSK